eukprot:7114-Heterococcus_DN1.PRE.1
MQLAIVVVVQLVIVVAMVTNILAALLLSILTVAAHVSSEPCLNTYLVEQQLHHHCTLALSQQLQQRHTT